MASWNFLVDLVRRTGSVRWSWPMQLLLGLCAAMLALTGRWTLTPLLGDDIPWVTSFIAVMLASVAAGPVAGAVAVAACASGGTWLFVMHRGDLELHSAAQ